MGAKDSIDYEQAFDEFVLVYKPKGMKQKEFAALKNINEAWLSVRFTEIRNKRLMERNKGRMPKLLQKALDNIDEALDEKVDYMPAAMRSGISAADKAKISIKAAEVLADRLGMSPQAMTINLQQNNQTKILIAPIFAGQGEIIENSFLGSKNADTESND